MKKKHIRIIASILLIMIIFKMFFPSFILAESTINKDDTITKALKENPSFNPSVSPDDGETPTPPKKDENGNEIKDGERTNDNIDYSVEQTLEGINEGTTPRTEMSEDNTVLKAGTNIISFLLSVIASFVALIPAAFYTAFTLMYWEEPPKDIDNEQYKGIKANLFTLENLFFNRIKILDANIFKKNENPNGTNQSIKDNVATWNFILRQISIVLILFIMVYLAIRLIIATVKDKPEARANYKDFLTDIFISLGLAFMVHIFIAVVLFASDLLTEIIYSVEKALLNKDVLNFEKVIIYSFFDVKEFFTSPTKKLINTISFIILVVLHGKFIIIFTKRFLTIAFLTIVSPFISITYAVDKFNDGKTQVFSSWAKEIIRLAFIMPLYAGMYTIFAVAMGGLAEKAPILGLLFLLFFGKIEKVIKEAFDMRGITGVKSTDDYSFSAGANKSRLDKLKKEKEKNGE